MTDPDSNEHTYSQVANQLRLRIYSGDLPPGDQLPSENQLIKQYGVSRVTVRGAVRELQQEGLVHTRQGKGTYVRDREPKRHLRATRYQLDADHAAGKVAEPVRPFSRPVGEQPGTANEDYAVEVDVREVEATRTIAEMLALHVGDIVLQRTYTYRVNGKTERYLTSYLPIDLVRGTPVADRKNEPWPGGTIAQLASIGQHVTVIDESIWTRMPTPNETKQMKLPVGVPVLVVIRRMFTGQKHDLRPVEAAPEIVLASDRIRLDYRTVLGQ